MISMNSDIRFPSRSNRALLIFAGVAVCAFFLAFLVSMLPFLVSVSSAQAVPNCSSGVGSPLLVDVTQHISNDPDSGFHGDWAIDNFTRHIQIWAEGDHYCGQADDNGTFTTFGGATGVSPQSGAPLHEVVTGTMVGGTHGVLTGTLGDANNWGTSGTAPAQDCNSVDCSMTSLWVNNYFPGGNYAYSPSPADSTGNWSWTYTAQQCGYGTWTNANAGSSGDIATPSNHCPEALNQHITTAEGVATTTTLTGTDQDHDTLYFTISTLPTHGTLMCGSTACDDSGDTVIGSTNGTSPDVTYTPDPGFTGHDQFDFTASDGVNDNDATVYITVTAPVVPPTPVCSSGVGSPLLVDTTQRIVGDPDSSVPGPNWALDTFTRHIQVWQETIGTDTHYCAQADDNGTFTTNGTISPQSGAALTETISGTMVGSTHGEITGGTLNTSATPIADPDCTLAGACDGLTGKWVAYYFGAGATYNYSPSPADSTGSWGWTYSTCGHGTWVNANAGNSGDIIAGTDCSVVTATNQSVTAQKNTALNITLAGTDSIPANTLTFATSSNPANGMLIVTANPAVFTYTPNSNFTGNDSFTFTVGDGSATSTGTVTITVNAPAAPQGGGNGGSTPAATTNGGGGGGVISGPLSVGFVNTNSGGTNGQVLGASTDTPASCSVYLGGYLKKGSTDTVAIKKLQTFLNQNLGLSIPVTGVFGPLTQDAVNKFQTKYSDDILKPWFTKGLSKDMNPSGYVYKTTLRMINLLQCSSLNIPVPQLP